MLSSGISKIKAFSSLSKNQCWLWHLFVRASALSWPFPTGIVGKRRDDGVPQSKQTVGNTKRSKKSEVPPIWRPSQHQQLYQQFIVFTETQKAETASLIYIDCLSSIYRLEYSPQEWSIYLKKYTHKLCKKRGKRKFLSHLFLASLLSTVHKQLDYHKQTVYKRWE